MIGDHWIVHSNLSKPCIQHGPKDTGIFVYVPVTPKSRNSHQVLSTENLLLQVNTLIDHLNNNYNFQFQTVNYGKDIVCIEDLTETKITQFLFHFCNYHQGIYLDWLSIPSHQSRKGIGSFCVNWLKDFAEDFGIKFIVLGSVAEARGFWTKMGFRLLQAKELHNFPGYQGRYSH